MARNSKMSHAHTINFGMKSLYCLTLSFQSYWTQSSNSFLSKASFSKTRILWLPELISINWLKCNCENLQPVSLTFIEPMRIRCRSSATVRWTKKTKKSSSSSFYKKSSALDSKFTRCMRCIRNTPSLLSWSHHPHQSKGTCSFTNLRACSKADKT